jgi:two-component system chemotaxis sensor kinase CheA
MKVSHLEAGQVSVVRSETEILHVANTLFNQFQPRAKEKNLDFLIDNGNLKTGTKVMTDEGKLKQILSNLLDNAFKFTDNGCIIMRTSLNDSHILFDVEDTGIGIDKEDHEKIFERFYQAGKSASRVYSGTGIGLSICAGYAELLGGTLQVKSSMGKGSVFTLSIPLQDSDTESLPLTSFKKQ